MEETQAFDREEFNAFLDQDPDDSSGFFYYATGDEPFFAEKLTRMNQIIRDEGEPYMRRYKTITLVQALSEKVVTSDRYLLHMRDFLGTMGWVYRHEDSELGRVAVSTSMRLLGGMDKAGLIARLVIAERDEASTVSKT
jgi:hypothetical protein